MIPVDTGRKEPIRPFQNSGRVSCAAASQVYLRAFPLMPWAKPALRHLRGPDQPGCVAVGQSPDPPEFAADALAGWWRHFGLHHVPLTPELLILAEWLRHVHEC
ncbi:MAG: hypothetical protein M5U01_24280 [Ardenticatenaceae bacterium]|nr:hypothetical protein [Ardenticatenaceae bacterium]HBY95756.1 hypothetical protein [Chloroflexota bacterium]